MRKAVAILSTLILLFGIEAMAYKSDQPHSKVAFAADRCLAKGRLGIVRADYLYIALDPSKNSLLLKQGEWTGLDASVQEVAIFFDDQVWSAERLPNDFDLSKAVVISFEKDKVRFFDFGSMSGCYYLRPGQPTH